MATPPDAEQIALNAAYGAPAHSTLAERVSLAVAALREAGYLTKPNAAGDCDAMIAELLPEGTDAEVEMHAYRDEDGLHVTLGYETDRYREISDYTLAAALRAALASQPKET